MASEERKAELDSLTKENLFKAQGAADNCKGETDQFKCGKCKGRRTSYYQMQTRSADEPMTTFVSCLICNNHWKVSLTKTLLCKLLNLCVSSPNRSYSQQGCVSCAELV
jgi:hypothetical protein